MLTVLYIVLEFGLQLGSTFKMFPNQPTLHNYGARRLNSSGCSLSSGGAGLTHFTWEPMEPLVNRQAPLLHQEALSPDRI